MAKRKIIWSRRAEKRLFTIFESDIRRGKGKSFAINLYKSISKHVKLLLKDTELGMITTENSIRVLNTDTLLIFYEASDKRIVIHTMTLVT